MNMLNTANELFYEEKEKNYPTEAELQKIKDWDAVKDPVGLIGFIKGLWMYPDYCILKGKRVIKLELHTMGWSGNENIIGALRENQMFFLLYWQKSTRGGHYFFRVEKIKEKKRADTKRKKSEKLHDLFERTGMLK